MATLKCSIISSCVAWFSLFTFFSFLLSLFFSSCLFFALIFLLFLFHHPLEVRFFFLQPYYCTYFPFCLLSKYPSHFPCLQSTKWYGQGLVRTAYGKVATWDSEVVRVSRRLESKVSQCFCLYLHIPFVCLSLSLCICLVHSHPLHMYSCEPSSESWWQNHLSSLKCIWATWHSVWIATLDFLMSSGQPMSEVGLRNELSCPNVVKANVHVDRSCVVFHTIKQSN